MHRPGVPFLLGGRVKAPTGPRVGRVKPCVAGSIPPGGTAKFQSCNSVLSLEQRESVVSGVHAPRVLDEGLIVEHLVGTAMPLD